VTLLTVGVLTGCATTEVNPWESIEVPREAAQQPVQPPTWPIPATFDDEGATFTLEQLRVLDVFREISDANLAIAREHAAQIEVLQDALAALVEAGQAQRVVADMRSQMLEEERKHNAVEKVGLWILVLGLAAAQ